MTANVHRLANALALLAALALIVFFCRNGIFLSSVDTVHHFVLVEELIRHHAVIPADAAWLGDMAAYPPGAHYLAALIAPAAGSGLVAMTWVAAASIFLCYVMLFWLAQRDIGLAAGCVFALILLCANPLRSFIGWEIVKNFFYPQLVGHVFAVAFLCATAGSALWRRAIPVLAPLFGAALMHVQPLVAIQVMGFGLSFLVAELLQAWFRDRVFGWRSLLAIVASSAACVAAILSSESFWVMRRIADNDGALNVGISHVSIVIVAALIIGGILLWQYVTSRGMPADGAVGSALASAAVLMTIQDVAWATMHQGSPYAVKKHLFIVTTLAAVAAARLIARRFDWSSKAVTGPIEISAAFVITIWLVLPPLVSANTALAPLRYARFVAGHQGVRDASIAMAVPSSPPLVNVMVSVVGFHHPNLGPSYLPYFDGAGGSGLASRLMVRHSPDIDRSCPDQFLPQPDYVVVNADCLRGTGKPAP